jgi:surfactin synthase thioesterase subunit/glycosyltransferase involved in cell wall biosynthesis
MRILLAHNSLYYPSHGGGDKSNRLLMEALQQRGHLPRVVARLANFGLEEQERFLGDLAARGIVPDRVNSGIVVFHHHGVEVHVVASYPNLRAYFARQIEEFIPSVVLASTDDPAQVMLEVALRAGSVPVVYLVRTTLAVPFGPDCAFPSAEKTEVLRRVDGVVGVSQYVADYVRRWSGIQAVHLPISLLEPGPYPYLGNYDNEFVTLVNPCAVKGISIFLALAERMPEILFAAVPTWGSNSADLAALRQYPNISILPPVDNIDELFRRTRVLLVPSLWAEARSRIVVEAMLRGVPVIASNIGGIPEAKLGVDYLIPVRPIVKYRPTLDEQMVPVAEVPEQDITPWENALKRLLGDRSHYKELSRQSREAALQYASNLSVVPFENYLEKIVNSPKHCTAATAVTPGASTLQYPLERLSPEKRRLLALRLKKRSETAPAVSNKWFPCKSVSEAARLRLFCFPYAGAGASVFYGWYEKLPDRIAVCPARFPGRESRLSEAPLRRMDELVEGLAGGLSPLTDRPFAFFGHSMGAVVAFELTRFLYKSGRSLPVALFVSGARAPQYRHGHVPPPEPTEAEFIDEVRRLQGIPSEVLDNPELMRVILPALRADTALYRNYVYQVDAPLPVPICAYGGADDPNIRPEHIEAWRLQTTSSFTLRVFPGGHFYIDTNREAFLEALTRDLEDILNSLSR